MQNASVWTEDPYLYSKHLFFQKNDVEFHYILLTEDFLWMHSAPLLDNPQCASHLIQVWIRVSIKEQDYTISLVTTVVENLFLSDTSEDSKAHLFHLSFSLRNSYSVKLIENHQKES